MRIDKFISDSGIASRKEASVAAKRGGVTVNGVVARDLSRHIDPGIDEVSYLGSVIEYKKYVYVMLNKPEGYVSATEDSRLPVVTELLSDVLRKRELFPVGRLDRDTVGLMILTDNGKLAHSLLSPKHHVEKKYRFCCTEPLPESAERIFLEGAVLGDGYECKSAGLVMDEGRTSGIITLTEGKYHQIKRMIASLGSHVCYLERISFADIPLDRGLSRGEWRYLTAREQELLEQGGVQ
jgi:16S rRNA pseudouridine516 synthase